MATALILIAVFGAGVEVRSEDPKFAEKVEEVGNRLTKVRQLEFKKPVSVGVIDRKRLEVKLIKPI